VNKGWGDAGIIDVWEDGYATKDLKAREGALSRRKSDLENRRKALTSLQRANTRTSNKMLKSSVDGSDNIDAFASIGTSALELDIATEAETLKYHADQIKM
jgi:hypothetical protein